MPPQVPKPYFLGTQLAYIPLVKKNKGSDSNQEGSVFMLRAANPSKHSKSISLPSTFSRVRGVSLLEIMVAIALTSMILVGIMASLSTGFIAQNQNSEIQESQLLVHQVLEEIQDIEFENLLSFNGQFVTSGEHQANITVDYINSNLIRVEVVTTSTEYPNVSTSSVTLIADRS